jgi:hypothetical protein
MLYELADGTRQQFLTVWPKSGSWAKSPPAARCSVPAEPAFGVTALESVGITVDPTNRTLR